MRFEGSGGDGIDRLARCVRVDSVAFFTIGYWVEGYSMVFFHRIYDLWNE